jgi:hypothetical protein
MSVGISNLPLELGVKYDSLRWIRFKDGRILPAYRNQNWNNKSLTPAAPTRRFNPKPFAFAKTNIELAR